MLKAICDHSYEKLELLCEEELTLAIAAKMYELRDLEGYEFTITEESKASEDQIEIVNHLLIRNMCLVRKSNPCLSQYKVVCTDSTANEYSYVLKTDASSDSSVSSKIDEQPLSKLEYMLSRKPLY